MKAKIELTQDAIPAGAEVSAYLVVQIDGGQVEASTQAKPINLSVVIDRSGSMRGPKIEYVKQAALELVRRLGEKDTFSLVSYDDVIEVPIPAAAVSNKGAIRRAIQGLTARGSTNLGGGWLKGCELVETGLEEGQVTRVLLLSDGLANRGIVRPAELEALARQKRAAGITTSTMGVGMDFNEDLLSRMAAEGGGSFYFIDKPDQASGFFSSELQDLQRVVGRNLVIQLETAPVVRAVKQITDYPVQGQGGDLRYPLGELFAGEVRVAVFELTLRGEETGSTPAATVEVLYDRVGAERLEPQSASYELSLKVVKANKYKPSAVDPELTRIVLLQKAGRARRKAVEMTDTGEYKEGALLLRKVASDIEESGLDDADLLRERDMLLEEANEMEAGAERFDVYSRKAHAQKISSMPRHARRKDELYATHMRHLDAKQAFERQGPPPTRVVWDTNELILTGECIHIGRAPDNDIVVGGPMVGDYQFELQREGENWFIQEGASPSGIRMHFNAGHLQGRMRLSVDDVLRCGRTALHFRG